jgi:uncharacterized damage-inducible protein DinB
MPNLLSDLTAHLAWADAQAFQALKGCEAAQSDPDVLKRLHHTAFVASAFATLLEGGSVTRPPTAIPPFADLLDLTRTAGERLQAWIAAATEADLDRPIHVIWFREPPLHLPAREALLQALLHSQHHRGQTMTRLVQLGGKSVDVDYIIWVWKGRPEPRWD